MVLMNVFVDGNCALFFPIAIRNVRALFPREGRKSQYSRSVDVFKIWKWDLHHILAYHSYFKVASTNISMGVPRINFFCEQNNLLDWPGFWFGLVVPVRDLASLPRRSATRRSTSSS